jgi:hypothetical protein
MKRLLHTALLIQQNAANEGRAKENSAWLEKQTKLEEEIKTLRVNLSVAEDLSATRYQRCEELQASAEKYHTLKIGLLLKIVFIY